MKQIPIPTVCEEEHLPNYASEDAAGADVKAAIADSVTLEPGASKLIPTGLFVAIPQGYEIQVRPRSGLALKNSITVLNTPGTIDADYRGEIGVILINHSKKPFVVTPKMRIAQLIVAPVVRAEFIQSQNLTASSRGEQGFGHTGTH